MTMPRRPGNAVSVAKGIISKRPPMQPPVLKQKPPVPPVRPPNRPKLKPVVLPRRPGF